LIFVSAKTRDRIIVFRVTQDEYRSLKEACASPGARNLSDFTRSEVLAALHSGSVAEYLTRRFESIETQIATMQSAIAHLNRSLEGGSHAASASQR
jgi:uncharacterized protein (DUF1778 family)